MGIGGITLGMSLEDVVHHRQTETAHEFPIELQVAVFKAVAKAMEVIQEMPGLFICQLDDGILVQRDAAPDTIVVRWQQILQELIIGSKPFHLHVGMCSKVLHLVGHGYHHQIVFHNVIAMLVEHKTPFPCRTKQVHTSVTQLTGVHPVEVC